MTFGNCKRFRRLSLWGDDYVRTPADDAFLRVHFAACPACSKYARTLADSGASLQASAVELQISPGFVDGVVSAINRDRFRRQLLVWRPAMVGAVAASLLLTVFTSLLNVADQDPRSSPSGSAIKQLEDEAARQIFRTPPPTYDEPTRVDV
jgi:hypothetical protein